MGNSFSQQFTDIRDPSYACTSRLSFAAAVLILVAGVATPSQAGGRDFALAIDRSGSMNAASKRAVLRTASAQLTQKLLVPEDNLCLLEFTKDATDLSGWTKGEQKQAILSKLMSLEPTSSGWTNIQAAKALAIKMFRRSQNRGSSTDRPQYLLLLTDGEATHKLTPDSPLYPTWEAYRQKLKKIVSFGKSGVTLALYAFDTPLDEQTAAVVSGVAEDQEISQWMEHLQTELEAVGGQLDDDIKAHKNDGLKLIPQDPQLMNQDYQFSADDVGVKQTLTLMSDFEVAYARGNLKAGITELNSSVHGRLSDNQYELDLYSTAGSRTEFELAPVSTEDNPEADRAQAASEQNFRVVIRLPDKSFPWSSKERIEGTLSFQADGELSAFGGDRGTVSESQTKPLPSNLPKPQTMSFVAQRPLNTINTMLLVGGIALVVVFLAGTAYYLFRPITVEISELTAASERIYRLSWKEQIRLGNETATMSYDPGIDGVVAEVVYLAGSRLLVRCIDGVLFDEGMPVDDVIIQDEQTIGLGKPGAESANKQLRIAINPTSEEAPLSNNDQFDWSG